MHASNILSARLAVAAIILTAGLGRHAATAQPREPAKAEAGVEVLTRGPIHEAFAETVAFDPQPGLIVSTSPPAAIEEVPPDQRPEGANVAWIPGYFAWDDERSDFLWVSGIWRALPPGRQWVPGYWSPVPRGFQWTSGYWADAKLTEVVYLPEPPQSVEAGPNIAAPSADQVWLPGSWIWQQNRYAWRPGYWVAGQADWAWMPSHYVWTPRGYVFIDGYYDYSVARRGVLFAPVYFDRGVYSRRGFSYTPALVINPAVFGISLFLRPNYQHYYFGDYYASNYVSLGYYPSYSYHADRFGYDPIYAQQRWVHRQDSGWEARVQTNYQNLRDHEEARPPRTWAAQQTLVTSGAAARDKNLIMAASLDQMANTKDGTVHFQPVNQAERQQFAQHVQAMRQFRDERVKLETKTTAAAEAPAVASEPAKLRLPPSPIVAKSLEHLDKEHAPPKSHDFPKPDPKIAPQPRKVAAAPMTPEGPPDKTGPATPHVTPGIPETPPVTPRKVRPDSPATPKAEPMPKAEPANPVSPKVVLPPAERPKVTPTTPMGPPAVTPKAAPLHPATPAPAAPKAVPAPAEPPKAAPAPMGPPAAAPKAAPMHPTAPAPVPKAAPQPPAAPKGGPPAEAPEPDPKKEPPKM